MNLEIILKMDSNSPYQLALISHQAMGVLILLLLTITQVISEKANMKKLWAKC